MKPNSENIKIIIKKSIRNRLSFSKEIKKIKKVLSDYQIRLLISYLAIHPFNFSHLTNLPPIIYVIE